MLEEGNLRLSEDVVIADSSPSDSGPFLPVAVRYARPLPRRPPVWPAKTPSHFENAFRTGNPLDAKSIGEYGPLSTDEKLVACRIKVFDSRAEQFTFDRREFVVVRFE